MNEMMSIDDRLKFDLNELYDDLHNKDINSIINTIKDKQEFDFIGKGNTRVCLEIPDRHIETDNKWGKNGFCMKLPFTRHGKFQNRNEIHNWKTELLEIQEHLMPVLFHHNDGNWLVMPKGNKIEPEEDNIDKFKDKLTNKMEDLKTMDLGRDNLIKYDGKLFISDYALLHKMA